MRHLRKTLPFLFLVMLSTVAAPVVSAASFTFSGTFTRDDEVRLFNFFLSTPGTVELLTGSYTTGGFSPVLSLFDRQANNLLIGRDNGVDNANGEARLIQSLSAGNYFLALTQFDNLASGPRLEDGFLRVGDPTFTREFGGPGATGPFLNIDGQQRSGSFAVTLNNVISAVAVPEPATSSLLLMGLGAVVYCIRRRQR